MLQYTKLHYPPLQKKKKENKLGAKWKQPDKAKVIWKKTKFYHPSLWSKSIAWSWTPYIQQDQKPNKEKSKITWLLFHIGIATKTTPN